MTSARLVVVALISLLGFVAARAGDQVTPEEFRARYAASMEKIRQQLGIPAPDEIYQINAARIQQRPRLYFGKLTMENIRYRVSDPHYAAIVAAILEEGEKDAATPPPEKINLLGLDPNRQYGDSLAWMAAAVLIEKDATKRSDTLKGLLAWTRAIPRWGVQDQDLVVAQTTFGLCTVYDWLYDELPAADRAAIREQIIRQVHESLDESRVGYTMWRGQNFNANHNWFNYAGRAVAALTLWGDEDAPLKPGELKSWLDDSMTDFWIVSKTQPSDGSGPEGTSYQDYGIRPYVDFSAMTDTLCVLKDSFFDEAMRNSYVRLFVLLPGNIGSFNYGDGYPTRWWGTDAGFRKLASRFKDPRLQLLADLYAGNVEKDPTLKKPRVNWRDLFWYNMSVPSAKLEDLPLFGDMTDFGIYTARRDWTATSSFFGLRCGSFGGKSVAKAFGTEMTDGHNYANLGEFNFYDGPDAIIPGGEYEKVKLTSNHSLIVFDGRAGQAGKSVGQIGEGGEWFYFHPGDKPLRPAEVLQVKHTANYHSYLMDLGGVYRLADERSPEQVMYPGYLRSIIYLPEGVVAVVDKVATSQPRSFQFRLMTNGDDLKVNDRKFTFTLNHKSCWINDFSTTDWERSVRVENLSTIEKFTRHVAILGAKETQHAVFAVILGVGAAGQDYKIETDDKGYSLTGLADGPVRVDWPSSVAGN